MRDLSLAVVGNAHPQIYDERPAPTFSWADVDALRVVDTAPADAFSVADYCKHYGVSDTTARRELVHLVDAGKLGTTETVRNGKRGRVYWVVAP